MDGNEIANAFNQQNDKKAWGARAVNRDRKNGNVDVVHFTAKSGMVSLDYDVDTGRFAVKFNKFQGAWGDYVKAIARSLYTVLNTLKSAGLNFEAPMSLAGMRIEATTTDDNTVYVSWTPQTSAAATMPELRAMEQTVPDDNASWREVEPAPEVRTHPEFGNLAERRESLPNIL